MGTAININKNRTRVEQSSASAAPATPNRGINKNISGTAKPNPIPCKIDTIPGRPAAINACEINTTTPWTTTSATSSRNAGTAARYCTPYSARSSTGPSKPAKTAAKPVISVPTRAARPTIARISSVDFPAAFGNKTITSADWNINNARESDKTTAYDPMEAAGSSPITST